MEFGSDSVVSLEAVGAVWETYRLAVDSPAISAFVIDVTALVYMDSCIAAGVGAAVFEAVDNDYREPGDFGMATSVVRQDGARLVVGESAVPAFASVIVAGLLVQVSCWAVTSI